MFRATYTLTNWHKSSIFDLYGDAKISLIAVGTSSGRFGSRRNQLVSTASHLYDKLKSYELIMQELLKGAKTNECN